jgi:hypothetical protein
VAEEAAPGPDPAAQAVTQEEEALLWRALSGMPVPYREPMVLFYREHQSVAEVASVLDLSEEAVKQRLSRGRVMLREEMAALVESTLTRTRPAAAFTAGVLAALPLASSSTASAATAATLAGKAAAAAKSVAGGAGLGAIAGPVIGLLISLFGSRAATLSARSSQERKCIVRHVRRIVIYCWVMSIGLALVLSQAGKLYQVSPPWLVFGVCAWVAALVLTIHVWARRMQREVVSIRAETGTDDQAQVTRQ